MNGFLQAITAGTHDTQEEYLGGHEEVPVYTPDTDEISGDAPRARDAAKYKPTVMYLESMTFLALLSFTAVTSHLLPGLIRSGTIAVMAGMWTGIFALFGLCMTIPAALRRSIRTKKHARRKLAIAVALTMIICYTSWLVATQ